jgi:formylglycine-generating enzyme required for sulfatase activity
MNLGPVESVDWNEASGYCKTIGGRLPTEKEWEYAARAGTTTALGMRPSEILGRFPLDGRAWYAGNSKGNPHPAGYGSVGGTSGFGVGENRFYLSDMLGNVWEWTQDNYVAIGRESLPGNKVARGGSWQDTSDRVRVSARLAKPAAYKGSEIGFRCVADWPPPNVRVD